MSDQYGSGTYRDPCPKCGDRLLGLSKEEYIEHLRENGETLAAKIEEKLVVEGGGCAGAKRTKTGVCAEASGVQPETCPECGEDVMAYVKVVVGRTGTVSKKDSLHCDHVWTERYLSPGTDREGSR